MTHRCLRVLAVTVTATLSCAAQNFFVAPDGDDTGPGTQAQPFASLSRARDAVRELRVKAKITGPVTVVLRGGMYYLDATFTLTPEDSGTAGSPTVYTAYAGETPVISAGRRITGWQREADGTWSAPVSGAFRQLFVSGARRTLARSPNTGFFRVQGKAPPVIDPATGKELDSSKTAFRFAPGDIKPWENLPSINAVVFRNWETGMLRLKSVDPERNVVAFTGPMKWAFRPRLRYYIEGVPEALDAPGEWVLDQEAGRVYYRPLPNESMATAQAIAPRIETIVRIQGDAAAGLPVAYVQFRGLSFQHAAYSLEPEGHCDWQAAVTKEAAIQADGARDCSMVQCEVAHVGAYAVWFRAGCSAIRIEQCEVRDCGAGGVRIGEQGRREGPLATHHNTVTNSFIHDVGRHFYGAIGVWIGQSSDNEVTHNEICDTNYSGVSVGWSWGFHPTTCHRNKIEFNHIHHIARGALHDLGAIYTLGISTGTTIRNNHIHHVWDWEEGGGAGGIYPDEGSSGILIENNLVYENTAGGLTVHYGRDNVVRNNIFAFARDGQIYLGRADKESSLTFENNIVYYGQGALFRRMSTLVADRNVYFSTGDEPVTFPGERTLAEWQAEGYDKNSAVADPLFVDAENYDFRLRPDSPALKLGFTPLDLSKVGLHGDADWVNRPKLIKRPLARIPSRAEAPPLLPVDAFEETPVGLPADVAYTHGETAAASIRITDEIAAAGKRCLKFVDAPGLDQIWNPHMYYSPNVKDGTIRLTFDLRIEPGAVIWHEWRDRNAPYRVGPSLGVNAQGLLEVRNGPTLQLPANEWIRFEIVWTAGKTTTGAYDLVVTVAGQAPSRFTALPCDPKCRSLNWLGFVSNATDRRVFYLDNVKMEMVKQP